MKAIITEYGNLQIERCGEWVDVICPFTTVVTLINEDGQSGYAKEATLCSQRCAMFGEVVNRFMYEDGDEAEVRRDTLRLCHKTIVGEITDERVNKGNGAKV